LGIYVPSGVRILVTGFAFAVCASASFTQDEDVSLKTLKELSVEQLMDIEVTSVSGHAEKLIDAASAIQVVTGDDIRRFGATTLPEALRLAGNLDVAQKNSHDWGISARGFNTELANKLLVLMDGRTLYTPLFSGVAWNVQDYLLQDLERIEVISGPGATLWGSNAVNGVINITTKSAKNTQGLFLEGGGGTDPERFFAGRYGGELAPGVFFRVYGKYSKHGEGVFANGAAARDDWDRGQGGFRVDAVTSAENNLTLQGDYYSGTSSSTLGDIESDGSNLLGRWQRSTGTDSEMTFQAYYDRTHVDQPVGAFVVNGTVFAPAGRFADDLSTYDLDFQHRFSLGNMHHLMWGLGFRATDDRVKNAPALGFFPTQQRHDLTSGFLQDELVFSERVSLTLGSKFEHNDYTGLEIEPSIRLQVNFAPGQMIWSAISRAVRTPSRIDRDLSQPAPPSFVLLRGSPDFQSEEVTAYELGYRGQFDAKLSVSAAVFYNVYDDIRSANLTPVTVFPIFFANDLEGETHGLEIAGDYRVSRSWQLHVDYRLLKESLHVKPGKFDLNNALNETSDPLQQVSVRSAWDVTANLQFNVAWRWVDERPTHSGSTPGFVPGYSDLDAVIAWRPTAAFELSVIGRNLLHAQHPEYGYPTPDRVEIERGWYAKASWKF
jgi:iron complex outermembrane receptor protein